MIRQANRGQLPSGRICENIADSEIDAKGASDVRMRLFWLALGYLSTQSVLIASEIRFGGAQRTADKDNPGFIFSHICLKQARGHCAALTRHGNKTKGPSNFLT